MACQLLAAAEQIRRGSGSPLFSFWIAHNEAARRDLRSALGLPGYEAANQAAARLRESAAPAL